MDSYNILCAEIDDAMKTLVEFITAETTVDELHDTFCIDYPIEMEGFFYAVSFEQVITTDDNGVEIADGVPLTFGTGPYGGSVSAMPNSKGSFGDYQRGPVTHQVRRFRVAFAAVDGKIRPFMSIEMPRFVNARWSHRFDVGFGALPGPVGVTIV